MGLQDVAWGYAAVFVGTLLAVFIFTPLCRTLGLPKYRASNGLQRILNLSAHDQAGCATASSFGLAFMQLRRLVGLDAPDIPEAS